MREIIRIDLNGVNCYLGKQDGNFILFDTGGHLIFDKELNNRRDDLLTQLSENGCASDNLKLIVLTHGDNDHAANASTLRKKFGTKIAMHAGDRALVENHNINLVMESFKFRSAFMRLIMFFMKNQVRKIMVKTLDAYEKFTPDIFLSDGDTLNEYGFDAQILHLPGHTPGSISILTANGELISGDTFANNKKPEIAPNAIDFELLKSSIDKIKKSKAKIIFPGHGKPFNIDELKL